MWHIRQSFASLDEAPDTVVIAEAAAAAAVGHSGCISDDGEGDHQEEGPVGGQQGDDTAHLQGGKLVLHCFIRSM